MIPVYAQACVRSPRSVGMYFPGQDVWQQPQFSRSAFEMIDGDHFRRGHQTGDLFPGAPRFWDMSLKKSSLQLIFPGLIWSSPGCWSAICFVLWQNSLPRADQPSSADGLEKLFPQSLHKIRNYSLKLPSFFSNQSRNVHTSS